MQKVPWLYASPLNTETALRALVVFPEIYGLNAHTKLVADRCAQQYACNAYAVDFFYSLTQTPNDFDYERDKEIALHLLKQYKGELCIPFFDDVVSQIKEQSPSITQVLTLGFCFGGSLVWLTALHPMTKGVISFYGGQTLEPGRINNTSIAEYVQQNLSHSIDSISLYGEYDHLISEDDRKKITEYATQWGKHTSLIVPAGHAFANAHRTTYDAQSAQKAWNAVDNFVTLLT